MTDHSTATMNNVLILNTRAHNTPVITNASGIEVRNLNFTFDKDTHVENGCSIKWRNEMWFFGGPLGMASTQVAKVDDLFML